MLPSRFVVSVSSIALGLAAGVATNMASAQNFPNRAIKIITGGAGGGSDLQARLVANGITGPLGQAVVIDNRSPTAVAAEALSKSAPDGYTLYVNGGSTWILPLLQSTPYEYARDFAPISMISTEFNVVAVHPSLPVRTIKELIAYAKAKPGEVNYATGSNGSTGHLATELLRSMADIKMTWIPHKGTAPAVTSVLGGQVQLITLDAGVLLPHAKSGKLRALAVTSAQPSALAPDLPTVASTVPGYESVGMTGIFAPAKTPSAVIGRLNQEVVRYLRTPEAKDAFFKMGAEVANNTPEQFAAIIKNDIATAAKLIKEVGIKIE